MNKTVMLVLLLLCLSSCRSHKTSGRTPDVPDSWFPEVDGVSNKGEYIDFGKNDRLYFRYNTISDSGIELERVHAGSIVWRVHANPLWVEHSKYHQNVHVRIEASVIHITSRASGGSFYERRHLETGELIDRTEER